MKLKFNFDKSETNYHGKERATIHGWKLRCVDLLGPIKERERSNPEGGKTRAKWYKRLILYFPSGAWWNLDIALVRSL